MFYQVKGMRREKPLECDKVVVNLIRSPSNAPRSMTRSRLGTSCGNAEPPAALGAVDERLRIFLVVPLDLLHVCLRWRRPVVPSLA